MNNQNNPYPEVTNQPLLGNQASIANNSFNYPPPGANNPNYIPPPNYPHGIIYTIKATTLLPHLKPTITTIPILPTQSMFQTIKSLCLKDRASFRLMDRDLFLEED